MMTSHASSRLDSPSLQALTSMQLNMGVQCNVRCTMCFQTDFSASSNMPSGLYKDRLKEVYPHLNRIKLVGGEPTIMKNCRDVAELVRDYPNIRLNVTTNGVNIDKFWHETFTRQGIYVNVSINAATQDTYDKIVILGKYKQVVRNLERLIAARTDKNTPSVCLSAVILKENVNEIAKLIQLSSDLGVDSVEFLIDPILTFMGLPSRAEVVAECARAREVEARTGVVVFGLERFEAHFGMALLGKRDDTGSCKMCTAPFNHAVVDWKGDVRVCCNTWVKIGNLNKSSMEEIWTGSIAEAFRKRMKSDDYMWCAPDCDANPLPSRLALLHKYQYQVREDPRHFVKKIDQKVRQWRGNWVTVKPKQNRSVVPETTQGATLVQIQK